MYTEESKRNIDWANIIKKGLIIVLAVLVVFFVIWLLTKNNNNSNGNINVNTGNSTNGNITNLDAYSEAFMTNYIYFHDTAKEYFLISELPNEGETLKYTLKEFINKGLLLPLEYQKGQTCDQDASYVSVTNINGEYKMTVTLVCGREVAKTTEELGCNQLCNKPNVDEPIIEYQYKQPYTVSETVYSCPSGYIKTGTGTNTKCLKTNSNTVAAKTTVSYICPDGYEKNGSGENTICINTSKQTIDAEKTITYTCDAGYVKTGTGANTKCTKTTSSTIAANYDYIYSCPSGYTKTGTGANTKCTKITQDILLANYDYTYSCPSGYTKTGTGANTKCTKTNTSYENPVISCQSGYSYQNGTCVKAAVTATPTYQCPSGYSTSGKISATTKCTKTDTVYETDAIKNVSYTCSGVGGTLVNTKYCRITTPDKYVSYETSKGKTYNGCSLVGTYTSPCTTGSCTKTYYKYYCAATSKDVAAKEVVTYTCANGATPNSNNKCPSTKTSTATATAKCSSGNLVNGVCQIASSQTATPTFKCNNGTLISGSCKVTDTETRTATTTKNYYCNSGYALDGTVCYKTTNETIAATATKNYYCNSGYALDGTVCYKTTNETKSAKETVSYKCSNGTLNGTKCDVTIKETRNTIKNTVYTCDSGYTKIGNGTATQCTKGTTSSINPTKTTKQVTKYNYIWSTETSLPGWERTEETRIKSIVDNEK